MSILSRRALLGAVLTAASLALAAPVLAQSRTGGAPNSMYAGIGLHGYDPVSYFADNAAAQGNADINATFAADPVSFIAEAEENWPALNQ